MVTLSWPFLESPIFVAAVAAAESADMIGPAKDPIIDSDGPIPWITLTCLFHPSPFIHVSRLQRETPFPVRPRHKRASLPNLTAPLPLLTPSSRDADAEEKLQFELGDDARDVDASGESNG